ncbi:hypothetical protein BI364_09515 [Acidihalobacter yilgarnensis]|uniref:Uncharacterized protein n=1 Tax=Acidihalobacter yilgarnensis TaxID=2819280 RepID=A0A1D8INZ1_9GAMM|nr:hypothetical protein BI364_09515 [Acidihalobacter yilgarnensis]
MTILTHETTTQPDLWLERYGSSLYRHALIRTGDPAVAEDREIAAMPLAKLRSTVRDYIKHRPFYRGGCRLS